jgi:hypothetical protein
MSNAPNVLARRSSAEISSTATDDEGLLSGWVGNALICATLPPIVISLGSIGGRRSPRLTALIIIWVTVAVLMQIWGMLAYFSKEQRAWHWRDFFLFAILILAIVAYILLALDTLST